MKQTIPSPANTSLESAAFAKGKNQNQSGPASGKQGDFKESITQGAAHARKNPCYGAKKLTEFGAAAPKIKRGSTKAE